MEAPLSSPEIERFRTEHPICKRPPIRHGTQAGRWGCAEGHMHDQSLESRDEIIACCLELERKGYVIGTYGNVSVRTKSGLMITPSRIDYQSLTAPDLVEVTLAGKVVVGSRLPSSELEVHRQIYVLRPDVGAVVHTHSLFATALSCLHETIPVIVEEQSQVIGDEIRCTKYVPAGRHFELGEEIARTLGGSNGVLVANHGTVSCGRSLGEAMFACQIVERVAQMRLLAGASGGLIPIPDELVRSERERWLYKYGRAGDSVLAVPAQEPKDKEELPKS
jgi:L-fuculose-phosphate aldolase